MRVFSRHVSQKPCPDGLFQLLDTLRRAGERAGLTTAVKAELVKGECILAYITLYLGHMWTLVRWERCQGIGESRNEVRG